MSRMTGRGRVVLRHVLYLGEINDTQESAGAELLRGCAALCADARGRVNGAAV
jgi:hypothetical protein